MITTSDIERLFRNNYKEMLVFANSMLHDEEIARDIVHDVFASLLTGDVHSVTRAYLMSGVRFGCLKYLRNLSTRERLNKLYAVDLEEIQNERWPDDEDMAVIREVVERCLPELTRRVVRLRFVDQKSYKEIAEYLSVSEVTVYKHLRHAINVLRQKFKNYGR